MVARIPSKQQKDSAVVAAPQPLNPTLLRDTVKKVDKCMARLQELRYTVSGGRKVISGVSLSPSSTRSYSHTSVHCKQESLRIKNANTRRSPGNLSTKAEEWRRMSLPAMLLGETMGEILEASQFARNVVEAAVSSKTRKPTAEEPRTPLMERIKLKQTPEHSELHARREIEKEVALQRIRSESDMPSVPRAKSRINFKTSPSQKRDCDRENCRYIANRVSPRNRPCAKKTVLFPNPLFHSTPTSQHQKFSKTKLPVIARNRQTPHKFLIKSPPASKFQVKISHHPPSISPTRATKGLVKKSPEALAATKLRRSFSPSRLANRLVSPLKNTNYLQNNKGTSAAAKLRRSFSPSRLANKLVSPLKNRKSSEKNGTMNIMSGLKQRPKSLSSVQFLTQRI